MVVIGSGQPARTVAEWHGPGVTVVVTVLTGEARVGGPVTWGVADRAPWAAGLPRALVVAASVHLPSPIADGETSWQFAIAADTGPPVARTPSWVLAGDSRAAVEAIAGLRRGAPLALGACAIMATLHELEGAASVLRGATGAIEPLRAPCFAWSDGEMACVLGCGVDGDEVYWDLAVARHVPDAPSEGAWELAFRASAYVHGVVGREGDGQPLSLRDLASRPPDLEPLEPSSLSPRSVGGFQQRVGVARSQLSRRVGALGADGNGGRPRSAVAALLEVNGGAPGVAYPQIVPSLAPILSGSGTPWPHKIALSVDRLEAAVQALPVVGANLPRALFWFGIALYLVTRLWGVAEYPIAFDGDEAGIVVLGRALLESGFRDGNGIWFPVFFSYPNWNPDVGLYAHLLASSIFGVSVPVARTTAVILTLPAPFALAAALRWGFAARGWWLAPFLLSALPAWFHLSRTAYDTATWVAFFACAVAAYFRYRFHDPRWSLQFVAFLLLTFYSNAIAHLYAVGLGLAATVIDWRYHRTNWRALWPALALACAGALPLATFLSKNPGYLSQRLGSAHPHWGDGTRPLADVAEAAWRTAIGSLHPMVWFVTQDRGRYVDVTGYHNYYPGTLPLLPWWVAPLVLLGIASLALPALRGRRAILVALIALSFAPTAIARFAPTRSLGAIVPVVLLATVWFDALLPARRRLAVIAATIAIAVTTTSAIATLVASLTTQSARVQDYGGYGIQWGSKEVFALVNRRLRETPGSRVMVTTDWTWGAHHFIKFFLDPRDLASGRVFLGSLETIMKSREPWGPDLWAILSPAQFDFLSERTRAGAANGTATRVTSIEVIDEIAHPDGSPGFVMARLRESAGIDQILAVERAASIRPTFSQMTISGDRATVGTTLVEDGAVEPVLNAMPGALVRFAGPNPTLLDVTYDDPRGVSSISMTLGAGMWRVTARLHRPAGGVPLEVTGTGVPSGQDSLVEIAVSREPFVAKRITYEIFQPNATEDDSTVHLYKVVVLP